MAAYDAVTDDLPVAVPDAVSDDLPVVVHDVIDAVPDVLSVAVPDAVPGVINTDRPSCIFFISLFTKIHVFQRPSYLRPCFSPTDSAGEPEKPGLPSYT